MALQAFQTYDATGDGSLNIEELRKALKAEVQVVGDGFIGYPKNRMVRSQLMANMCVFNFWN